MLIEFSVNNYKSFKDKTTFSMEMGNGNEYLENIFKVGKLSLLKTSAIYGANASGKTNLIEAMKTAINLIRKSNINQVDSKLYTMVPFSFNNDSTNKPCEFEFIFVYNNIKYKYGFSADINKIYNEYLYIYYSQKPTMIFDRKNTNNYEFLLEDKNKLIDLSKRNSDNKLFLATATTWNYDKTKDAYLWFANSINVYINLNSTIYDGLIKQYKDMELKKFTLKLLKETDIDIKDYYIEPNNNYSKVTELDIYNNLKDFYDSMYYDINDSLKNYHINVSHEIIDELGNKKIYDINFDDESSGTKLLFGLAPMLKKIFDSPGVLIIDEFERSMHPTLTEFIVKLFNNSEINKSNSQLIFTTHDVNLLDCNIFRRDQIWFTEKNEKSGVSNLYSLNDFSVRKEENIRKGYLNGRYGAIPFIKDNL